MVCFGVFWCSLRVPRRRPTATNPRCWNRRERIRLAHRFRHADVRPPSWKNLCPPQTREHSSPQDAETTSPSPRFAESAEQNGGRAGVRFLPNKISRFEPLNLVGLPASVVGCNVAASSSGASWFPGLPAGETGSGRRHAHCLVTPPWAVFPLGRLVLSDDDRAPGE